MDFEMRRFFTKYVKGTANKAMVINRAMFLCRLSPTVIDNIHLGDLQSSVRISSRCLKHLYDQKPAEEFIFLLDNLYTVVKHPQRIYLNKGDKRGGFALVSTIGNDEYFCSIEPVPSEVQIATAFRIRDPRYLKNYTLLWSWKDGDLPRNAGDPTRESANVPQ
jgi:hypothetical protein